MKTKNITPFDLARIKKGLKMGDIAKISGVTGYTPATIQTALKGDEILTTASRIIVDAALEIVKANSEEAERIYAEGRKAFEGMKTRYK